MHFGKKLTTEEIELNQLKPAADLLPEMVCYWVTVTDYDLKKTIHVYITDENAPIRWQQLTLNTCLGRYAESIIDANFMSPYLQDDFNLIKMIASNLNYEELTRNPWRYFATDNNGPYMIVESVHRQIAAYIHYFIWNKSKQFEPNSRAICAVSNSNLGDFSKVPRYFC